jgi:hypothetical protein
MGKFRSGCPSAGNARGYVANKRFSIYVPEFRTPVEPQREILDPVANVITGRAKN